MLWLLVQPPERGGPGFDPLSARRLTIEEALFYLGDENATKTRCMVENAEGDLEGYKQGLRDKLKVEKDSLRKFYAGTEDLEAAITTAERREAGDDV